MPAWLAAYLGPDMEAGVCQMVAWVLLGRRVLALIAVEAHAAQSSSVCCMDEFGQGPFVWMCLYQRELW